MEQPRALETLRRHGAPGQGLGAEDLESGLMNVEVVVLAGDVHQLPDLAHGSIAR